MIKKPLISVIVTVYKDEPSLKEIANRILLIATQISFEVEIIFVNDNSPDDSQKILLALAQNDPRIKIIKHSRSFGSQAAFLTGLRKSCGDACVLMDGDLQDPPELIFDFYQKWKEGYKVIVGERVKREGSFLDQLFRKIFYRVFSFVCDFSLPVDAGDFSMIDKSVVEHLVKVNEKILFLRGNRAFLGFKQASVPYFRPRRKHGKSTNSFLRNFLWVRIALFNFSRLPVSVLYFFSFLSFFIFLFKLNFILLLSSGFFLGIAIIADYLFLILSEVKNRPQAVIESQFGFDQAFDKIPYTRDSHFQFEKEDSIN